MMNYVYYEVKFRIFINFDKSRTMYKNELAFAVYNECKIFIYKFTTYVPRTFRMDKNYILIINLKSLKSLNLLCDDCICIINLFLNV